MLKWESCLIKRELQLYLVSHGLTAASAPELASLTLYHMMHTCPVPNCAPSHPFWATSVAKAPLLMPNSAGSLCCLYITLVVDACRFCWAIAMQLECCRLCCSLPQPSWSSSASQSLPPSSTPYPNPGRLCKGTLKPSGIGAPSALSASLPPPPGRPAPRPPPWGRW